MAKEKGAVLLSLKDWSAERWLEAFADADPDRPVVARADTPDDPSIRYALVWKPDGKALAALPNLEVIFSAGAGVDHIFETDGLPDVPVVRVVADDMRQRMSEYVVWQVLDHHRMGPLYRRQQAQHRWHEDRRQPAASDVTVGIMGLGELGSDAARKLLALGFAVSGWSRTPKDVDGIDCHHGDGGLDAFLSGIDILVVLLPLTRATRGILDLDLFRRMKPEGRLGAPILVNAGRGGLQNEDDILTALESRVLGAVSLDVFSTEPLPADHPLWDHPRVTITPHAAASSDPTALVGSMVAQMNAHETGRPLVNLVDPARRY